MKLNKKTKIITLILSITFTIVGAGSYGAYKVDQFFDRHTLNFQSPVRTPVIIENRLEARETSIIKEVVAAIIKPRYPNAIDEYIYEKFGQGEVGDKAVRIARAENGRQDCDLIIIEPNETVSVGVFMINSAHFTKFAPKDLVDCYKNVDAAFRLYTEQGNFSAWSTYKSGAYEKVDLPKYLN